MNDRNVLTLIEQTIAVFILALAAAICLKVFAYSSELSNETERISDAYVLASNASESIKYASGDFDRVAQITGWTKKEDSLAFSENGLDVTITKESESEYLGCASVCVLSDNEEIISFDVMYQR